MLYPQDGIVVVKIWRRSVWQAKKLSGPCRHKRAKKGSDPFFNHAAREAAGLI